MSEPRTTPDINCCDHSNLGLALALLLAWSACARRAAKKVELAMVKKMFKILCPIERKDGKTHWMRVGTGFPNKDDSVNLYLDVLPANLKLQLRELTEEDLRVRDGGPRSNAGSAGSAVHGQLGISNNVPF